MKRFAQFLSLLLAAASLPLLGADPVAKGTEYTATVSGIVCASCKAHVTEALKKLPGVTAVEVTKGAEANTQKVTFAASTDTLTKQDAVNALGESASQYQILSLDKTAK
jgi:copper chaperone CopZ